ncbi:MAG: hypothetical protein AB7M12_02740 [Hyphomonadaceae bacterium]
MTWVSLSAAIVGAGVALALLAGFIVYAVLRSYIARSERTYMTHDERGFKRALAGKGVLWDFEESIVKGAGAPRVEYVALDLATGRRKAVRLLDERTGAINLRPQFCVPLPFTAVTADSHRMLVEARVQFSLNRDLLGHVYQIEDFGLALDTRIQSAFRAEIGKRQDETLRASLHDVEVAVIELLRQGEREGDEAGELGMALGVNFHSASFTYSEPDEFSAEMAAAAAAPAPAAAAAIGGGKEAPAPVQAIRLAARTQGVLALRPQQLDLLADVFKGREPGSTQALLAILEMQTRQNIAEALAGSGQLVVVTTQDLGLAAPAQRDAIARAAGVAAPIAAAPSPTPNGAARPG